MDVSEYLYLEINIVSYIFLILMFINNMRVYKITLNDPLNMLLFATLISGVTELLWFFSDNGICLCSEDANTFISIIDSISCVFYSGLFTKYVLGLLDKNIKNKILNALVYYVPSICELIFLLIKMAKGESYTYGNHELTSRVVGYTTLVYLIITVVSSFISFITERKRNEDRKEIINRCLIGSVSLLLWSVVQYAVIDMEVSSGTIAVAVIIFFLTSQNNTHILLNESIKAEKRKSEMDMATKIQVSMLPINFEEISKLGGVTLYASMKPAKEVGGDFYDFYMIDDDHLALNISDVSDKGVPAALFMAVSKALLKANAKRIKSPKEIMETTNCDLFENNNEMMFVTSWMGILEISTGILRCVNAGHEFPAIKRESGYFELLKDNHGMGLGTFSNAPYMEYEISLNKGDMIYVYTDGVAEAKNSDNILYGMDRMIEGLNKYKDKEPRDIISGMSDEINLFVGDENQFDDITMLCIRYEGK